MTTIKISPKNELSSLLLANVNTNEELNQVVDSICKNTELTKQDVIALFNEDYGIVDEDLLKDVVTSINSVVPYNSNQIDQIFDISNEIISNIQESGGIEEVNRNVESKGDAMDEPVEEVINSNFSKVAEAILALDERNKAVEDYLIENEKQKITINFVNRVANLANSILSRPDIPNVTKRLLFGDSKSIPELCKNIIKAAELDGVSVDTYVYAMEAIVKFHEATKGLLKFSQTYKERKRVDPNVIRFAKAIEDEDDRFLKKIGFDLSKPETFIK